MSNMNLLYSNPPDKNQVKISKRQMECLELVSVGKTSKEIGRELGISPSTVDNHIQAAIDRLNAKNRTDAIFKFNELSAANADAHLYEPRVSQGEPIVECDKSGEARSGFGFLSFPPLGGRPNNLSRGRRLYHIMQIAMLSIVAMTAAVLTIAGLVHVISP